ncbi:serine hydrolase domain-containing protein [Tahibacter soli]|uniref:Serine hydrolase n=1 Tax=Tahibacter soli TaxID=2983605 RepID=A0A9X4BJ39_9GAMM|nr:serine hydrolase domain-containing protein [Tahibacter soli]MDC8014248.1 serine hydrolase [Tahibacter soli]
MRALLLIIAAFACADARSAEPVDAVKASIRDDIAGMAASRKAPGIALALVVDGKTLWAESFGQADRGTKRALTNATRHAAGDLSKPLLAALAVRMAADGTVDLDAPVTRYLPDLAIAGGDAAGLTLRRLLTHHGGLPPNRYAGMYRTADEPAAPLPADALYFAQPPGLVYAYSNIGVELAAQALAAAGKAPYPQLLRERVLEPLGLGAAGFDPRDDDARGHRKGKVLAPTLAREQAALGLKASLDDLARFAGHLTGPDAARYVPLYEESGTATPLDLDYRNGLAFSVFADPRPGVGRIARLTSFYPGFRGRIDLLFERRVAVIVLANAADAADLVDEVVPKLRDAYLKATLGIAPRERDAAPPATVDWPAGIAPDSAASSYATPAGLVATSPTDDGFDARVLGLRLAAERRDDGWYRLHLKILGIPLDFGFLRRVLVAPARVDGRRILMGWAPRQRFLLGSAWNPPALAEPWRRLAGRYRLTNPDKLTEELGIQTMRIDESDGVLTANYALDSLPFLETRVPLEPDGERLRVPGVGPLLGERLDVQPGEAPRVTYSGYVFEKVP